MAIIDDTRLLKLKEWMPLSEAIHGLSSFCSDEIHIRDLLELALNGSLTLSLYLRKGTRARPCLIISRDEMDKEQFDSVNADGTLKGYLWESEDKFIKPEDTEVMSGLEGCHDLIMAGGVLYELNNMVTQLCGLADPKAILGNLTEIFLGSPGVIVKNKNGQVYELMSRSPFSCEDIDGEPHKMILSFHGDKAYHPMVCLPLHESPLVIRTSVLRELVDALTGEEPGNDEQRRIKEEEASLRKVLNTGHAWHSPNLALAIEAWGELFGNKAGSPVEESKPPGGYVKIANEWLHEKKKIRDLNLTDTLIRHMAELINPDKSKGPGKTKGNR